MEERKDLRRAEPCPADACAEASACPDPACCRASRLGGDTSARDARRCRTVENAIFRRAKGYKVRVKKTYKVKRVEYDPDTGKKTLEREELETGTDEVHVPADVRAGAYFLNNRDPARWREHPRAEEDEGEAVGGIVELPEAAGDDADPAALAEPPLPDDPEEDA